MFGQRYVELAVDLGVGPDRDRHDHRLRARAALRRPHAGRADEANAADLGELIDRLADGRLGLPVAATFPLAAVRDAYAQLEQRHTLGKNVLLL
jgi:NADPH:quinone reductase-like Zn-dependent oxidoreductase